MKILVVEDLSTTQQVTGNALQRLGFRNFHQTGDANTALAILSADEYDLILIDWDMPGLLAIEMLRAIRASSSLLLIPVLMITHKPGRDKITEAAGAGVNGYLVRPFSAQQLQEKIAGLGEEMTADAIE